MAATASASPARPTSTAHPANPEITSARLTLGATPVHPTAKHAAAILSAPTAKTAISSMALFARAAAPLAVVARITWDVFPALLVHICRATSAKHVRQDAPSARVRQVAKAASADTSSKARLAKFARPIAVSALPAQAAQLAQAIIT